MQTQTSFTATLKNARFLLSKAVKNKYIEYMHVFLQI